MARSIGEDRPGAHWHVRLFDGVAAVGSHVVATYAEARELTAKHARGNKVRAWRPKDAWLRRRVGVVA